MPAAFGFTEERWHVGVGWCWRLVHETGDAAGQRGWTAAELPDRAGQNRNVGSVVDAAARILPGQISWRRRYETFKSRSRLATYANSAVSRARTGREHG
jgi:hypothetical protein